MIIEDLRLHQILPTASVRDAIANLTQSGLLLALVVDDQRRLLGVVGDGDIRRGLLAGYSLDDPVQAIMNERFRSAPVGMDFVALVELCRREGVGRVPLIDEEGQVQGLFIEDKIGSEKKRGNIVFVMAGGRGVRLGALTETKPKPMIPIAGKPMLQHVLEALREDGFTHFVFSVNYLAEQIIDFFGDGRRFGVEVTYVKESEPLGTAGSLSLLAEIPDTPMVVINGDLLLSVSVGEMLDFHSTSQSQITVGVKMLESTLPYGVVELDGGRIVKILEKPVRRDFINAGIYVLEPGILKILKPSQKIDMTDIISALVETQKASAFPIHEDWMDLGTPGNLALANIAFTPKPGGATIPQLGG